MERENHCRDCGFDLSKLDMTVLYAGKGVDGARRKLYCPICRGGPVEPSGARLTFPRGEGVWVRWREAAAPGGVTNVLQVGRLRLRIDARVETLNAEQICYRAVPVFTSGNARVCPALPVMPEYLDCLDAKQLELALEHPEKFGRIVREGGKYRYRCVLPLRGLRETEWPTYECDVLPASPNAGAVADLDALAFRGVSVRVWPNLKRPTREWKYYVVAVGAATEEGLKLVAPGRAFRARMLVPEGRDGAQPRYREVPLEPGPGAEVDGAPASFVGASANGRPAWISLEFYRPTPGGGREPIAGGLLALQPASGEVQLSGECSLGIDFGTSNTVVAVRRPDGAIDCVAPERGKQRDSTTLHLVDGGPVTLRAALDLWPGGEWAGPYHDLLPSELACTRRWTDVATKDAILALALGREFGVPLRTDGGPIPPEHVVGEFKWLRAVQKEKSALAHQEVVEALQSRYLEAALLMTLAALLAESPVAPRTVTVYYSYPLAFEDHDLKTLERAAAFAERRLKELTGAEVKFLELMDEAHAAVGPTGPNRMFRVCADLGGGSLEVLVDDTWARAGKLGHEGMHPHVFSTSLFFGGSVYLRSLIGASENDRRGACVMPAMASYTRLASEVRKWEHGRRLIESPDVIAEAKKATAVRRARVFIGYIIELMARVLASVCLEHGRTREGALDLSRNRLFTLTSAGGARRWVLGTPTEGGRRKIEFSLVLLGNGWGFADIVRDGKATVEEMVAQRVRIRLTDLLREVPLSRQIADADTSLADALGDEPGRQVSLDVTCEPEAGVHRKARVARGLLESQDQPQSANHYETRAIGRHGVLGFDVSLADSGRVVPWYRPFGPPARDRPELMRRDADVAETVAPRVTAAAAAAAPVMAAGAYGFAPSAASPLEGLVLSLAQQWPQVGLAAAQHGISPYEYAGRQLWGAVLAAAAPTRQSPEQYLAVQHWEQLRQGAVPPGTPPEQAALVWQQRWQAVVAQASARGMSPEALLAGQRWESLIGLLARSVPVGFGPLPPAPPFPVEPGGVR